MSDIAEKVQAVGGPSPVAGQVVKLVRGPGGSFIKVVQLQSKSPQQQRKLVQQLQPVQPLLRQGEGQPETFVKSVTENAGSSPGQNIPINGESPFLPVSVDEEMSLITPDSIDTVQNNDKVDIPESSPPCIEEEEPDPVSIDLCGSDEEVMLKSEATAVGNLPDESIQGSSTNTNITIALPNAKSVPKGPGPSEVDGGCIVCNGEMSRLDDPKKLNSVNLKVKHYFCQMMGISDAEGVQMSFDEGDSFPFCEDCSAEVGTLMSVGNRIEVLYKQFDKLRDSLASRSVKTFFARTRPELFKAIGDEDGAKEGVQAQPRATKSTPWDRLTKSWKAVYEVNSPGHMIPTKVRAADIKGKPAAMRLTYKQAFKPSISTVTKPKDAPKPLAKIESEKPTTSNQQPQNQEIQPIQSETIIPDLPNSEFKPVELGLAKSYQCSECPKAFQTSGLLAYHSRIHSGELPFECETCGKGFAVPHYLVIHMRSHTGERPFTCEICHKGFAQRGGLVTHSLVHTGAKPYACDICEKSFRQKYHLTQHLLIHTGSKPFGCDICGKFFNVKMNLREHKRRHTGDRPYKCPYCVCIGFFRKRMLRDHVVKSHPSKELPAELADLGETRIPPSLTKEGRKAYKSSNAARRNRKKKQRNQTEMQFIGEPLVSLSEDGHQSPSKDMPENVLEDSDSVSQEIEPSLEEANIDLIPDSETTDLIIDVDNNELAMDTTEC